MMLEQTLGGNTTRERRLGSCTGASLLEMALVLTVVIFPLIVVLVEGGFALREYHIMTHVSREGGNLVARGISFAQARALLVEAAKPLDIIGTRGTIIISRVQGTNTGPVVAQQERPEDALGENGRSRIGPQGGPARLPDSLGSLGIGRTIFVVEVIYRHDSLFMPSVQFDWIPRSIFLYDMAIFET